MLTSILFLATVLISTNKFCFPCFTSELFISVLIDNGKLYLEKLIKSDSFETCLK